LAVIDSSPESLELNRKRIGRPDVDYLVADLITWQPPKTYGVVFFSFWLSHVPRSRFRASDNHSESPDPYVIRRDSDREIRRVHDGREFQVVEVFYEPEELQSLLRDLGWTARLDATRGFIFGEGVPC
jgi:hypothetical protein